MPGFELFGEEERKEVNDVLQTGILMRYNFEGPRKGIWKSRELESVICQKTGAAHTLLTSSGTSALTVALAALGIGAGDEVIMPSFTFVASFEAVLSVGAIPVVVDIDETLTLNPEAVIRAIGPRTKALMPVHMCGSMADMDGLLSICREHNLLLLEDACQSIGASYKGKSLGTMGDAGTFSFDFVKTVTCAEGGAVLTNNKETYLKADGFSDHGHDHLGTDRGAEQHPFIGYNFRISELHAAVGLAQIRKLDQFLEIQKRNHAQLKDMISQIPEVSFRHIPDPAGDSCTFLSWFLPTEALTKSAVAEMKEQELGGNFYWFEHNWHYIRKWEHLRNANTLYPPNNAQKEGLERLQAASFYASDAIMSRCVSTQISLVWSQDQLKEKGDKMCKIFRKVVGRQTVPV